MSDPTPTPPVPPAADDDAQPDAPAPFARVPGPLRAAIENRGFTSLTAVQEAVLDTLERGDGAGEDLRISSQTGSGKTVAVGFAIAPAFVRGTPPGGSCAGPNALVVVPTRELAAQVREELEWLFENVRGVRVDSVTGGTHVGHERRRLMTKPPRILVGTPGRLVDHLGSGALDLSAVTQLVLDEADQMLDMGFRDDLEAILAAAPAAERRTHMLSATFPPAVHELTERYQHEPIHVEGTRLGVANADIAHVAHVVQSADRYAAVVNLLLLAGKQRTLIFVATRAAAGILAEKLAGDGFPALPLSGDLAQAQRTRTLNAFRNGTIHVLVATDVAARGLDVPDVSTVIHGDLPMDGEIYTHRSGRTGRAGRKGRSILLATPNGERRARRLFHIARVQPQWQAVPSAEDVDRALGKRARRAARKAIEEPTTPPAEADVEFARSLLEDHDPAVVVATLLANVRSDDRPRDPFTIDAPAPRDRRDGKRTRDGQDGSPARGRGASRPPEASFTRFRINWGFRHGANPRRLLAAICRRGDVNSSAVGAIDIDAYASTFDVHDDVAREFERRAARRDSRDPHQRIERFRERPRSAKTQRDA